MTTADARRHLCVVGAAGRTGRELVRLAIERGHRVTALARSADKLAAAGLDVTRMVTGDARDSGLHWTIVRANMLTDRPPRGRVHVETGDRDFSAGDWRLSRADFARVLYEEAVGDLHVARAIEVTGSLGRPGERPLAASEVAP